MQLGKDFIEPRQLFARQQTLLHAGSTPSGG